MIVLKEPIEFEWDEGNSDKNQLKHKVTNKEAEELFFDKSRQIYKDVFHSQTEERYIILGKTNQGRLLYCIFTWRKEKIRIISVRDINKREAGLYEKKT